MASLIARASPRRTRTRLARPQALRAHRLAELLEYAQAHSARPLARRDALGPTPLLRLAEGELSSLPRLPELPAQARDLLLRLPPVVPVDLAPELATVRRGLRLVPQASPLGYIRPRRSPGATRGSARSVGAWRGGTGKSGPPLPRRTAVPSGSPRARSSTARTVTAGGTGSGTSHRNARRRASFAGELRPQRRR